MFLITEVNVSRIDQYKYDMPEEYFEESEEVNERTYVIHAESMKEVKDMVIKRWKEIGADKNIEDFLYLKFYKDRDHLETEYTMEEGETNDYEDSQRVGTLEVSIQCLEDAIETGKEIVEGTHYSCC